MRIVHNVSTFNEFEVSPLDMFGAFIAAVAFFVAC